MEYNLTGGISVEIAKHLIVQSRVIAKGERIRDIQRLVDQYGGKKSKWVKKSSPVFESEGRICEYHWYEYYGIGRFETKLKVVRKR